MPVYIIKGEPVSTMQPRKLNLRYWESFNKIKHEAVQQLEEQNPQKKLFEKPLDIELHFYFYQPRRMSVPIQAHGFNSCKPDISNLVRFVESIIKGTLIKNTNIIVSIETFKKFSDEPHTEIIITEIENGRRIPTKS